MQGLEKSETRRCGVDSLLSLDDNLQPLLDLDNGQWRESEPRAAGLDSRSDFVDVVADDAESDSFCVLLDD